MDISIVIPAFNEENKISRDVEETARFLDESNLKGEVIVVDDGSADDTAGVARGVKVPPGVGFTVIRHERNDGKGCAVRTGMKASKGEFAMFADSGLCIPLSYIITAMNLIRNRTCDIAHASRRHPQSVIKRNTTWTRQFFSLAFRKIVPRVMGIRTPLTDTQCGFKIYRGSIARELYPACRSDGFMFDIEIILRAEKKNYIIKEFPIEWITDPDTRIRLGRTAKRMVGELAAIKRYLNEEQ